MFGKMNNRNMKCKNGCIGCRHILPRHILPRQTRNTSYVNGTVDKKSNTE